MSFGEKLFMLREKKGLTQEALAKTIGISKQNISRYENSNREPNIRTAKKIADALGVPLEELTSEQSSIARVGLDEESDSGTFSFIISDSDRLKEIDERSDRILDLFRNQNLTYPDISKRLKIDHNALVYFVSGIEFALSDEQIKKLSRLLKCDYTDLCSPYWPRPYSNNKVCVSDPEFALLEAWRAADEKARRKVAIDLEDYGFRYHPKE